ncbi:MAG: chemotaxis protein CheD [Methanosarcinaceae archaeon]|nr:chemotaxis protein CheD [Methanosarcinaceae archaeon]MDD4496567.1 chemotaxis protein CheD [Methanosarcinaceae archaeon]
MLDSNKIVVGIADCAVAKKPLKLSTVGLGSCVGITVYDKKIHLGGLLHIMLPSIRQARLKANPAKFADSGIEYLLEEVKKEGAVKRRLEAKIAGGASMFANSSFNIGERNIRSVKQTFEDLDIPIVAEDTGKNYGRTIIFDTSTGTLHIKSAFKGNKEI